MLRTRLLFSDVLGKLARTGAREGDAWEGNANLMYRIVTSIFAAIYPVS